MAGLTDREKFEEQLFQPPHAARMTDHAGRFVERLDSTDRAKLLEDALNRLWETHDQIKETKDVLKVWIAALEYAAARRPRWKTWFNVYEVRWVKGTQLGR